MRAGPRKLLADGRELLLFDVGVAPGERTDVAVRRPELAATLGQLLAEREADADQGRRSR